MLRVSEEEMHLEKETHSDESDKSEVALLLATMNKKLHFLTYQNF